MTFDWKKFEELLLDLSIKAIHKAMAEFPDEHFYAVAYHEFYYETFEVISEPCLATNTVEELEADNDAKWSSPDWYWTDIPYANKKLKQYFDNLQIEANRLDVDHWHVTTNKFTDSLIKVAKKMTAKLKKHPQTTGDFSVFVFDEERSDELEIIQRCISPSKFAKLFPYQKEQIDAEAKLNSSSIYEQLEEYRSDLWLYKEEILNIGEAAIPMLLNESKPNGEQRYRAANILGIMGIPNAKVIEQLRNNVLDNLELCFHDARALGLLGDIDFFLDLAKSPQTRDLAIPGICSRYGYIDACRSPIPLNYKPLEQLLSYSECRAKVKELYHCSIEKSDINEALRGLKSRYKAIREHAVCALGNRALGKEASKIILPALVKSLNDRSPNVRRLAIINLHYWKTLAKPYLTDIRRCIKDSDYEVRSTARHYAKFIADA